MKVKPYQNNPNMLVPYYLMYSYAYYKENESLISDAEYDKLKSSIINLENRYPFLKEEGSVKEIVGLFDIRDALT